MKRYEATRNVQLSVWRLKNNKQGTIDVFRKENATRETPVIYLEVKRQQARYQ